MGGEQFLRCLREAGAPFYQPLRDFLDENEWLQKEEETSQVFFWQLFQKIPGFIREKRREVRVIEEFSQIFYKQGILKEVTKRALELICS